MALVEDEVCRIDGFGPLPVVRPRSAEEAGEIVRGAAAEGRAVYPVGGGTALGVGLPPERPGVVLDTRGLAAVVDYPARDMTITVQAGITLAELQSRLAAENQRLPVDVPRPERATLGGALAVNASGPRRYGFGTPRDYVIGISVVNDEGHETKAGGRVVKNVAGYDLCKLHVGALGTLGLISQVTLKLRPLPEAQALLALGCEPDRLEALLDLLHRTRTRPTCLDLLNGAAARAAAAEVRVHLPEAPWVAVVGYEDNDDAVSWQVKRLIQELGPDGARGLEARAGSVTESLWRALADLPARPDATLTFKANLLSSAVAGFCRAAAALPEDVLLHAQAGSGVVRGHVLGDLTAERAATMLKGLADLAAAAQGNLVVPHCPAEWKRTLPVWGRPRNDLWLMRRVKEQLDPRRLFNPGRFLDGI
jgi:glycolate oxidase FAD binding subunit